MRAPLPPPLFNAVFQTDTIASNVATIFDAFQVWEMENRRHLDWGKMRLQLYMEQWLDIDSKLSFLKWLPESQAIESVF